MAVDREGIGKRGWARALPHRAWHLLVAPVPSPAAIDENSTGRKNLLLLIQLRWIAVVGQMATILVVILALGARLPLASMAAILAALAALNFASLVRLRQRASVGNVELFAVLMFDVVCLTVQLSLTGGATNPFVFLFLLQVILAAVLLEAWSTWILGLCATLSFAILIANYRPLDMPDISTEGLFRLHVVGSLVCFALIAALLVVFVSRINRNLRDRDLWLASLRQQAAEEGHIVRMGLLASGAAHELGTPLSTVSVILSDWRRMPALTADPELRTEIDAMQSEVQRCKAIVTNILLSAGEARSESAGATTLHTFLAEVVREWRTIHATDNLSYENPLGDDLAIVADSALRQSLFNILDNAFEASPAWIGFKAVREGERLILTVTDVGPGFSPEILGQFGKPYQSSKGKQGGGLGLFLVVNVARKFGGSVQAANRQDGGAVVTVELPLSALAIDDRHG